MTEGNRDRLYFAESAARHDAKKAASQWSGPPSDHEIDGLTNQWGATVARRRFDFGSDASTQDQKALALAETLLYVKYAKPVYNAALRRLAKEQRESMASRTPASQT